MNKELTQEDYKNILALINRANITGGEAMATAILQQKLASYIEPTSKVEGTPEVDTNTNKDGTK